MKFENLRVRIIRIFKPDVRYSLDMVLQNSKGDRIHVSIGKYDIKFFKNKMEELGLYRINNFVVTSNSKKFKTTTHKHRYRLQVRVMDGTGLITLLLWNREAVQLMGKTAKELKEGLIDDDECSYPSELDDIIEKKLMFKVMVKESNIYKQDEVYKVLKFADDESLFEKYCHPSLKYTVSATFYKEL
ncbi:putative late blight resistance protein -like protein R1B-16-like [Capsicum annuum]|nr:putative late blight resistance protein -like protein R1B-16-like [Capsicum annuum]